MLAAPPDEKEVLPMNVISMIGALIALMTATLNLVKAAIEFVSIARKDRAEKKK